MAQLPTNPIVADYLAGSILTLVLPLAVLIAIAIWYVVVWRKGAQEGATAGADEAETQRASSERTRER